MLVPEHSLNTETLGITGAIYKRLYKVTNDHKYLDKAIGMYQKGYVVKEDYYNGENYANCLIFKASNTALPSEEQTHWYFFGKKIYSEVIDLLQGQISELDDSDIDKWMYATLSTSYHAIEDQENYEKYRKLFECSGRLENWELDTYKDNLKEIDEALEKIKG